MWLEPMGLFLSALAPLIVLVYNFIDIPLPNRDKNREKRLEIALQQIKSGDKILPEESSYEVFCELITKHEDTNVHPSKFQIVHGGYGSGALGLHYYTEVEGEHEHEEYVGSKELVSGWIESEIKSIQRSEERLVLLIAAAFLLAGFSLQFVSQIN